MCSVMSVCVPLYLFDGEVVDQVVVVLVEAAVQRDAVGVEEQVLRQKEVINPVCIRLKYTSVVVYFCCCVRPKSSITNIHISWMTVEKAELCQQREKMDFSSFTVKKDLV